MEKDHHLDAPDNDSLQNIEQITDHSELSTIYPHGHNQWDGTALMSREEREQKRDAEQERISTSIRRWFVVIGILVPVPFVLIATMLAVSATYLKVDNLGLLLLPIVAIVALAGYLSYRIIRFVYEIFYSHAIKAAPFVGTLLVMLGISIVGAVLVTQPLHTGFIIHDVLIISAVLAVLSIVYSGILLAIWTSRRMGSLFKLWSIIVFPLVLAGLTALFFLF